MKKKNRIKKNENFKMYLQKGKSIANRQFVMYTLNKADQNIFELVFLLVKK